MQKRLALLLPFVILSGCASLESVLSTMRGTGAVPYEDRPVQSPLLPNTFVLTATDQTVIGEPQVVFTRDTDTFSDLAREYGLGYDEIVAANPGIDPWRPGENTPVLLPTQYVLPNASREGVVLNIAAKRLFYFSPAADGQPQQVLTYPIGIGRVGWETPLGETRVIAKARDPSWWVPASVRKEHAEMGDPLPAVVPPGPDNPLGTRVLKLDIPGYLIHGTNQPYGVGMRVSHGCVRLYPENIELLYPLVDVGESVRIVNEPYLFGKRDGVLYFEAHTPLEDDAVTPDDRLQALFAAHADTAGRPMNDHLQGHVRSLAATPTGLPISVVMYDENEFVARARVVHNTIEPDPDAPTLTEVREMMDAIETEIEEESL